MADLVARLADLIAASPFHRRLGFRVEQAREGFARIRLPYDEANTTARSALHGGAIAATADLAAALAAWSGEGLSPARTVGRTLSCDVSYLAGALGEDIFGEAEVLRRGKEIVYSGVRVLNTGGKLLATANHVFHLCPKAAR